MINKLIFFIILLDFYLCMIVYPFKTAYVSKNGGIDKNSKEYNSEHFMNDYYDRLLYTTMKIGNSPQEIKVILTYQDCGFKIGKAKKCVNSIDYLSHYNRNDSSDFQYTNHCNYLLNEFDNKGSSATDTIYSYTDVNLKNLKNFKDIGFYLGSDTNDLLCGVIGFKMDKYSDYCPHIDNIIRSFKSNDIINNYNWIFKYDNLDEGLLIIGSNLKDIIPKYNEEKVFRKINSAYIGGHYPWSFYLKEMIVGNESFRESEMWVEIENDFSLLLGNSQYKEYIYESFFELFFESKICSEKEWEYNFMNKFLVIECNKDFFGNNEIKKFPNLSFVSRGLEAKIQFENTELFTETKYKYFFNVIFSQYRGSKWLFGKLFLQKYPTMFNLDANTIEIYDGSRDSDNISGSSSISPTLKTILFIVGIIILVCGIGILGYFLGKNLNKMRKRKANELDDEDYEYSSKNDNNDSGIINNNTDE